MRKKILGSIASLLFPFAAYGIQSTYGAYQRRQSTYLAGYQPIPLNDRHIPSVEKPSDIGESELTITAGSQVRELVIIDATVPDKAVLQSAIRPGIEIVLLKVGEDALEKIAALLKNYKNLDAVHLVSHGEAGAIVLGDRRIDKTILETHPQFLAALGAATRVGADLLLYGCNLASEDTELLEIIKQNSHLDIAASNNLTGAGGLGGDWALEIRAGNIETGIAFSEKALLDFSAVLQPFGVRTFEGFNTEVYQTNPSVNFGDFTTFIQSNDLELLSGTINDCENDLYVSIYGYYDDSSRFYIRSEPSGNSFGITQLVLRRPGSRPTTQVNIQGFATVASTTAIATKNNVGIAGSGTTTVDMTTAITTGSFTNIAKLRIVPLDNSNFCLNSITFAPLDSDGNVTAAGGVSEPVGLATTVDTVGEAVNVFDFTISDGGTSDNQALTVSQIVVNVSGTSTDAQRDQVTWRLNGPDVSNVTGTYNAGSDTITFSGLAISVAHGGNETYTINAYYNNTSNLTEDRTIILSVDGDTNLTVGASGTQMGSTSAITNGTGTTIDVVATTLAFTTQPAGSVSGAALTTQPVVAARDAFGNTDVDFTETITLTEASAGSLTNNTQAATAGVATFTNLIYTATADQQSFTLTANDQDGVGSNLPTVDANAVTSDVVASQLVFDTQPAPTSVISGQATNFTTVPVVSARDANNLVDTGYATDVTLAEINGAGSATLTGTGDTDGNAATVSITLASGVATFTGLQITYTNIGASETFNLRASSGGLTAADSSQFTSASTPTVTDGNIGISGATGIGGAFRIGDTVTATWNNTGGGDNNAGITGVTVNFSEFGGGAAVAATESSGTWTAIYTLVAGAIDATNRNVSVTATNAAGANTTADTTNATVDNIAPTVSSVSVPANGTYIAGQNLDFTVNTNENVTVNTGSGTPRITLTVGATARQASYLSGSGTSALVFRYTVQVGDNDTDGIAVVAAIDANGGTLRDDAGNDMTLTLNSVGATTSVLVDAVAPTVNSVSVPANGTYIAGQNLDFTVNYSEAVTINTGGGTPRLALTIGVTTSFATYLSGSGTGAIVFRYTVQSGDNDSDGIALSTTLDTNGGTIRDSVGNNASTSLGAIGSLAAVLVDTLAPTVIETTPVTTPTNDSTPNVTINVGEVGTLAVGGSCGSSDEGPISTGNQVITLTQADNSSALADATYSDCTVIVTDAAGNASSTVTLAGFTIDTSAPVVSEVTPVTTPTGDTTPNVTINVGEAGILVVGGSCGSPDEGAIGSGNQTVTLTQPDNGSALANGTYNDCTVTVTDAAGNSNSALTLTGFVVDIVAPNVTTNTSLSVSEGGNGTVDNTRLTATDNVGSAANVTFTLVSVPANGTLSLNAGALSNGNTFTQDDINNSRVTYQHDDSQTTGDTFTFTVRDALNNVNDNGGGNFTFNFTITGDNDVPVITEGASVGVIMSEDANPTAFSLNLNATDADNIGNELTWSIATQATNGTASASGAGLSKVIGYTPNLDFNGSDSFVVQVSDGTGNDTIIVNVTIDAVNDAPIINGTPATSVVTTFAYSFTPSASDVDTGDTLTFGIVNQPSWADFDTATGALTGTPGDGDVNNYTGIVISVNDGTVNTDLPTFNIDVFENVDTDGDGITDAQETVDGTDPNDPDDYLDAIAPVITAPASIVLDATGLYTPVTLKQLLSLLPAASDAEVQTAIDALGTDNADGSDCCNAQGLQNSRIMLPSGSNQITWIGSDRKGNAGQAVQNVNIRPLVSVAKDQIGVEGGSVSLRVFLNGLSPSYPLDIPYVIDASGSTDNADHNLVDGVLTFNAGEIVASVSIDLTDDMVAEGDEMLVIRLDDTAINAGATILHAITITEDNVAPDAALTLQQNAVNTPLVITGDGNVTVTANVNDPNAGDTHTYDWSGTDTLLMDTDGDSTDATFVFDPSLLSAGVHTVQVSVTDAGNETVTRRLHFRVVAEAPVLDPVDDTDGDGIDDLTEGFGDSDNDGIPDYLDNIAASNVLPESVDVSDAYLMECDPGVRCRLGRSALPGAGGGAYLDAGEVEDDEEFDNVGGLFDFEIQNLPVAGQNTRIAIPLRTAIPIDADYRKLQNNIWMTFVEDANNELHSAAGEPGYCPPPGDVSWQPGLNAGDLCVQLTIEDGGANDADGVANNSIEDPGGIATAVIVDDDDEVEETIVVTGIRSKTKGGGVIGWPLLLLLSSLVILRSRKRKEFRLILGAGLLMLISVQSSQAQPADWTTRLQENAYLAFSIYQADGTQDRNDFINDLSNEGVSATVQTYDVSRTAYQIHAGYRYHPMFAVELGYLDMGDTTINLDATASNAAELAAAIGRHYPIGGNGWTLSNRFDYPFRERFHATVEAGVYIWDGEIALSGADIDSDIKGGTDPLLGFGVTYGFNENYSAQLGFKRLFFDEQEVDLWGGGVYFGF